MHIRLIPHLKISPSIGITPQLRQAIQLLQVGRVELVDSIHAALAENPMLEEVGGVERDVPGKGPGQRDERKETSVWEAYPRTSATRSGRRRGDIEVGKRALEEVLTKTITLEEHLNRQLSLASLTEVQSRLGALVIGNLSPDGYLVTPIEELADEAAIPLRDAEEVLRIIQQFDPVGVGARDLRECLSVQAALMKSPQPLVETIIDRHLGNLAAKRYAAIATACGEPLDKVVQAIQVILRFEPKPARRFQSTPVLYATPDVYVYRVGKDFHVSADEDGLPRLRLSSYYERLLREGLEGGHEKSTVEYLQNRRRAATWFLHSIHFRKRTIVRVTECIVARQREFFEQGVSYLRPMILRDVASDTGLHESTVSRATTNKFAHTPMGIFELKFFFNSAIETRDGENRLASEAVRQMLRDIVAHEDASRSLSDQDLADRLEACNVKISRRTVAKYRSELRILPSSQRKKAF